jgi:hypothetical protein
MPPIAADLDVQEAGRLAMGLGISRPAGKQPPALPLDQQRNGRPSRPESRGSHLRGALWQVRQNRFHRDRFRCGGTRARAKRVRGELNVAACSSRSARGPGEPTLPLPPAGPAGRSLPGAFWDPKGVLVLWGSRARARRPRLLRSPSLSLGSQKATAAMPLATNQACQRPFLAWRSSVGHYCIANGRESSGVNGSDPAVGGHFPNTRNV